MIGTVLIVVLTTIGAAAARQQPATCSTADDCRRQAHDAIAARAYETAHDLAWLAYQRGSRQDPATLALLARAQSLSGRTDDAVVMLTRLAEAGVVVDDVEASEDFRRVRADARWDQLTALFARAKMGGKDPAAGTGATASAPPGKPLAPPPATPDTRRETAMPVKTAPPATDAALPDETSAPPPAPAVSPKRAAEDLNVSTPLMQPAALAYDSVSARFVLGSTTTDALTVISQTSTNATSFTSRGWSGHDSTTAIAVDRRAGDLWVAVAGAAGASLHRLQLISGRRLESIDLSSDAGSELVALAILPDALYGVDRRGRRVLRRPRGAKALEVFATLPPGVAATALAASAQALYVAHEQGVLRIDLGSRRSRALAAPAGNDLSHLRSTAFHDGVLLGVQPQTDGQLRVVRLHVNTAGTAVTKVDTLDTATAPAAAASEGVYYYFTADPAAPRPVLRAIAAK